MCACMRKYIFAFSLPWTDRSVAVCQSFAIICKNGISNSNPVLKRIDKAILGANRLVVISLHKNLANYSEEVIKNTPNVQREELNYD